MVNLLAKLPGAIVFEQSEVYIDRSRWKFDEDGFALAKNAAKLQAEQQMREKANSIFHDLVTVYTQEDSTVTIGGIEADGVQQRGPVPATEANRL